MKKKPKAPTAKRRKQIRSDYNTYIHQKIDAGMEVLDAILQFKGFIQSSFEPKISDVEIIVSFADVRGFTEYCHKLQGQMQDRKIQNFLGALNKIYNQGLLEWYIEFNENIKNGHKIDILCGESNDLQDHALHISDYMEVLKHAIPKGFKNLGDGLMIIWEVPQGLTNHQQGLLTHSTLAIIRNIRDYFIGKFQDMIPADQDAFTSEVQKLKIGFGLAKGHAWRLDYGHAIDYAGSIINLASRLQDKARPEGIVAMHGLSPWMFDRMIKDKDGKIIVYNDIKGYSSGVKCWAENTVK